MAIPSKVNEKIVSEKTLVNYRIYRSEVLYFISYLSVDYMYYKNEINLFHFKNLIIFDTLYYKPSNEARKVSINQLK